LTGVVLAGVVLAGVVLAGVVLADAVLAGAGFGVDGVPGSAVRVGTSGRSPSLARTGLIRK
jgi:hypothetical protein